MARVWLFPIAAVACSPPSNTLAIERVDPSSGANLAPVDIQIEGANLRPSLHSDLDNGTAKFDDITVTIGDRPLDSVVVRTARLIEATVPAGLPLGPYAITVTAGPQLDTLADGYTVTDGSVSMLDAGVDASSTVDSDGDTIVDASDNCPAVANPNQRDWDMDARGDVCDGCPHIPNEGGDGDGDGVPDACDPRPTIGGDTQVLWTGFYDAMELAGWTTVSGTWSVSNGVLAQTSTVRAVILSPLQYQRVYVATETELATALPSGGVVGTCSGRTTTNSAYDCCEVVRATTPQVEAASVTAGQLRSSWSGTVGADSRVEIRHDTVDTTNTCRFSQGTVIATQACTKDGATGHVILWTDGGATARFRYLFVVQIGP